MAGRANSCTKNLVGHNALLLPLPLPPPPLLLLLLLLLPLLLLLLLLVSETLSVWRERERVGPEGVWGVSE
jgi:hypothetical protein